MTVGTQVLCDVVLYCVSVPGGVLCCTVCRYRVVCCVVLCAGTGWYVVLYCVPVPGGMLCCTVCRYRVVCCVALCAGTGWCVVLYCVPVPGGMSTLRWCSMEMKLLRHFSCHRLNLNHFFAKRRVLLNVMLNFMKSSDN